MDNDGDTRKKKAYSKADRDVAFLLLASNVHKQFFHWPCWHTSSSGHIWDKYLIFIFTFTNKQNKHKFNETLVGNLEVVKL